MSMLNLISLCDELIYRSYEHNRLTNPKIEPKRWALIYPNINELEEKFKEKHFRGQDEYINTGRE